MVLIPTVHWQASDYLSATVPIVRREQWINPYLVSRVYENGSGNASLVVGDETIETELPVPSLLRLLNSKEGDTWARTAEDPAWSSRSWQQS